MLHAKTPILEQSWRVLHVDVVTVAAMTIRPPLKRKTFWDNPKDLEEFGSFSSFFANSKEGLSE